MEFVTSDLEKNERKKNEAFNFNFTYIWRLKLIVKCKKFINESVIAQHKCCKSRSILCGKKIRI